MLLLIRGDIVFFKLFKLGGALALVFVLTIQTVLSTTQPVFAAGIKLSSSRPFVENNENLSYAICGFGSGTLYFSISRPGKTFPARSASVNLGAGSCSTVRDLAQGRVLPNTTYKLTISSTPQSTACSSTAGLCDSISTGSLLRLPWNPGETNCVTNDGPSHGHGRQAIDFGLNLKSVRAARGGTVTYAGWENGGGGYTVHIQHNDGAMTTYNHLNAMYVAKNQDVSRGTLIAQSGSSGKAYGPHLHFATIKNGEQPSIFEEVGRILKNKDCFASKNYE